MTTASYDADLDKSPANFQPLTPLSFLERAARVFPDHVAIVHGPLRRTYREFHARARRLASALARGGIRRGDIVSVVMANTPAMLECHYGVPMTGAVLNTLNTRLDSAMIAFALDHADAKVLITDREFSPIVKSALETAKARPLVIDYDDPEYDGRGERFGSLDYEAFLAAGDPGYERSHPSDEWDAISLNYTSGTTGNPKGVVYHHRAQSAGDGQRRDLRYGQASGVSVDAPDVPLQRLVLPVVDLSRRRDPCVFAPGACQDHVRAHGGT